MQSVVDMKTIALFFQTILIVSCLTHQLGAYRILCLFSTPSRSHQIVFRSFSDALVARGHSLVIATSYPKDSAHPNVTYIDWSAVNELWSPIQFGVGTEQSTKVSNSLKSIATVFREILDVELGHPEIGKIIAGEAGAFDLVIAENHLHAFFAFAKVLRAPLIVICSSDPNAVEHSAVGNVYHSVAAPVRITPYLTPMALDERVRTVTFDLFLSLIFKFMFNLSDVAKKHLGEFYQSDEDLAKQIDMLFINSHPLLSTIRPITPKTIMLGFLHTKDARQPLPTNLQAALDKSQHGVVYCSFGSHVRPSLDRLEVLIKTFEQLKYDVFLKYDNKIDVPLPKNVKIFKWLPQADLLAHPNVKLFITQGGQHSIEEAIMGKVPLLVLPIQGDQPLNAKRIAKLGIGKWRDFQTFSVRKLQRDIEEIIETEKFKENVINLRKMVLDQPNTSLERAVWWTEYTIRTKGADHLAYHGVNVPLYQYYYLDVIAIYLVLIGLVVLLIRTAVKLLIKFVRLIYRIVRKIKSD